MPLPTIADVFRVALNWASSAGDPRINVIHISAPTKTEAQVFASLDSNVTANCWAATGSGSTVERVVITKLDGVADPFEFDTGSPAKWSGGAGSADFIPQVAALMKLISGSGGRRGRGRIFLPDVAESVQVGGILNSTNINNLNTGWDDLANGLVSDGMAIGVASYVASQWRQATTIFAETFTATQRRRQHR